MSEALKAKLESWGRYPQAESRVAAIEWLSDPFLENLKSELPADCPLLAYGQGRSYGDCCLNQDGALIVTRRLDRLIGFDPQSGILRCEAGVTLRQIIDFAAPRGFFLQVSPGTKNVSVGGAIANDVHGKNHHRLGTFGCSVARFMLQRSDGSQLLCSPVENAELFSATIGGIGLTGLILWADLKLRPIETPFIRQNTIKFVGLDEFFEISRQSDRDWEYTVAWVDCLAKGSQFARGIFIRGEHAKLTELPERLRAIRYSPGRELLSVPVDFPGFVLNPVSIGLFNTCYYNKQIPKEANAYVKFDPFFYPLDAVGSWNKIYGKHGLFQFQCALPKECSRKVMGEIMQRIVASGRASFLAVLKEFGAVVSPGMLSFPRPGVTLCLDLPNSGQETVTLLKELEALVVAAQGAMYTAKDALMSAASFAKFYPRLDEFRRQIDPRFSSSLSRRLKICAMS